MRTLSNNTFEGTEEEEIRLSFTSNKSNPRSRNNSEMDALDDLNAKDDDINVPLLHSNDGKDDENTNRSSLTKEQNRQNSFVAYWSKWTEDGVGMFIGLLIFIFLIGLSQYGINLSDSYMTSSEWPMCSVGIGALVIATAHYVLNKPQKIEPYSTVLLIAVTSRAIGNYSTLSDVGLSASLWCILIGVTLRSLGVVLSKGIFSGEFFVKIGVCLMCMDFTTIVDIGAPGLVVAWLDTTIVITIGTLIATRFFKFDLQDSLVVAGATCICGSSAATAISSSVHVGVFEDDVCKGIIAIMGVLNAPLMPVMPLVKTLLQVNAAVVGAWIGGSVDSTGQVVASAEMGGDDVLKTAVIIKMAQNILIGPICLVLTSYFQNSFNFKILVSRFPLFVFGFLITSVITTSILNDDGTQHDANERHLRDLIIDNSWEVAEWMTLIGFACIGMELDIRKFFSSEFKYMKILKCYLIIQAIDLITTFGWSYVMFYNYNFDDDEE